MHIEFLAYTAEFDSCKIFTGLRRTRAPKAGARHASADSSGALDDVPAAGLVPPTEGVAGEARGKGGGREAQRGGKGLLHMIQGQVNDIKDFPIPPMPGY